MNSNRNSSSWVRTFDGERFFQPSDLKRCMVRVGARQNLVATDYKQCSRDARDRCGKAEESSLRHSRELVGMESAAHDAAESLTKAKQRQWKREKVRRAAAAAATGS